MLRSVWGIPELENFGHKISAASVLPLPSHMAAIQGFSRPSVIKELQAFLGMVNFYRRFLHSIAHKRRPLTDGLRGSKKGSDKLKWLAAMDAAFAGAKQALISATHLAHPALGAHLSVVVDASAIHVSRRGYLARVTGSPWDSSPRSSRLPSRSTLPLIESSLPATPESDISSTCQMVPIFPLSRTTSPSPMPLGRYPTLGQHASPASCPTWQNTRRIFAKSPGQPTWWLTLSQGRLDTWLGCLPWWLPV
jgi:hypothetical protein